MRTIRKFDLVDGQHTPWADGALEEVLQVTIFPGYAVMWGAFYDGDDEEEEE